MTKPLDTVPSEVLLENFRVLANSEAFMRFSAPDLLRQNQGLLKELFLAALQSPEHRREVESTYRGHVSSGKIKPVRK